MVTLGGILLVYFKLSLVIHIKILFEEIGDRYCGVTAVDALFKDADRDYLGGVERRKACKEGVVLLSRNLCCSRLSADARDT